MKHIKIIHKANVASKDINSNKGCGECRSSCQSACKTSCTVANQICKQNQ
ncbi:MAG: six-cysteine peptide SCIFF [Thermoanaerobacterales bacterium]|nr:six-cysteine peptide SCIFF [Thermoanaerobacterales bacterium]